MAHVLSADRVLRCIQPLPDAATLTQSLMCFKRGMASLTEHSPASVSGPLDAVNLSPVSVIVNGPLDAVNPSPASVIVNGALDVVNPLPDNVTERLDVINQYLSHSDHDSQVVKALIAQHSLWPCLVEAVSRCRDQTHSWPSLVRFLLWMHPNVSHPPSFKDAVPLLDTQLLAELVSSVGRDVGQPLDDAYVGPLLAAFLSQAKSDPALMQTLACVAAEVPMKDLFFTQMMPVLCSYLASNAPSKTVCRYILMMGAKTANPLFQKHVLDTTRTAIMRALNEQDIEPMNTILPLMEPLLLWSACPMNGLSFDRFREVSFQVLDEVLTKLTKRVAVEKDLYQNFADASYQQDLEDWLAPEVACSDAILRYLTHLMSVDDKAPDFAVKTLQLVVARFHRMNLNAFDDTEQGRRMLDLLFRFVLNGRATLPQIQQVFSLIRHVVSHVMDDPQHLAGYAFQQLITQRLRPDASDVFYQHAQDCLREILASDPPPFVRVIEIIHEESTRSLLGNDLFELALTRLLNGLSNPASDSSFQPGILTLNSLLQLSVEDGCNHSVSTLALNVLDELVKNRPGSDYVMGHLIGLLKQFASFDNPDFVKCEKVLRCLDSGIRSRHQGASHDYSLFQKVMDAFIFITLNLNRGGQDRDFASLIERLTELVNEWCHLVPKDSVMGDQFQSFFDSI